RLRRSEPLSSFTSSNRLRVSPSVQSPLLLRRKLFGGLVSQTRTPPECGNPKGRFGRGLGNPHGWILGQRKGGFRRKNQVGASEVPPRIRFDALTPALPPLVRPSHAQAPAVLDHSRTLPQGDGRGWPAFAGGAASGGGRDCPREIGGLCWVGRPVVCRPTNKSPAPGAGGA